jgi:hypothetical protein
MLSLEITDGTGQRLEEAATVFDRELLDYFVALAGFPALQELGRLDPDAETPVGAALQAALQADLEAIAPRVRQRALPEPPDWVGLEGLNDIRLGEPLGWAGLADVLRRLSRLLTIACEPGIELWAVGD